MEARKDFVYRTPVIRGACILAVIASHVSPVDVTLLEFCVPVFVALSGFTLSLNNRNEKALRIYRRTLKFLFAPYLIYSGFYAIPHLLRGATHGDLWRDFLSSNIEQHLWFMPMIIGLFLLHPWLRRLYRKSRAATCIGAVVVQFWVWPWARTHGLPDGAVTTLLSFAADLGYFVGGYLLLDHVEVVRRIYESRTGRIASLVVWALWPILGLRPFGIAVSGTPNRILMVASFFATLILLAARSRPVSKSGRRLAAWVSRFGLYAYGIYLLHPIMIAITSRATALTTGMDREAVATYLIVLVVVPPVTMYIVRWLSGRPGGRYVT